MHTIKTLLAHLTCEIHVLGMENSLDLDQPDVSRFSGFSLVRIYTKLMLIGPNKVVGMQSIYVLIQHWRELDTITV